MSSFCILKNIKWNDKRNAPSLRQQNKCIMRIFVFTPFQLKGSMVIEGSLSASLFLLFLFSVIYAFQMISVQSNMDAALHQAGNEIVFREESYYEDNRGPEVTVYIKNKIGMFLGEDYVESSCIKNGIEGLDFTGSEIRAVDDIVYLSVSYHLKPLVTWLLPGALPVNSFYYSRAWTGYDVCRGKNSSDSEEVVYVTETGSVYHIDYYCNYLHPSVQNVEQSDLPDLRNSNGSIFYLCESCGKNNMEIYYITQYGNRYHSSLNCNGLKRTIYVVGFDKAVKNGKRACNKCN